jgi:hypothetical protein
MHYKGWKLSYSRNLGLWIAYYLGAMMNNSKLPLLQKDIDRHHLTEGQHV